MLGKLDEPEPGEIEGWAYGGWDGMSTIEITVGHLHTGMVPVYVRIRPRDCEPTDEEALWVLIDPNGATVYRSLAKARMDRDALEPEYRGTIHPVGPRVRDIEE